jgi:hypothetical protein
MVSLAQSLRMQRPGRRATSILLGLVSMLVLIDAAVHPGSTGGLWTVSLVREATAIVSD